MPLDRILVTVKTYPTLSKKYGELVCTAGVRENGSWVRLYPIPFRGLYKDNSYTKYDWLETIVIKNHSDPRPETYQIIDTSDIKKIAHVGTQNKWRDRRQILLRTGSVYCDLKPLLEGAKENRLSLATFKPSKVIDFVWEKCDREWDPVKIEAMRQKSAQGNLLPTTEWTEAFKLIPKLPYNFSYKFIDASGRKSKMQVLDWECGQLYWNCLKAAKGNEIAALGKVKEKYFEEFTKKNLHFFLGTLREFHGFSPNPWVIIGVFPAPHVKQLPLHLSI